MKDVQKLFDLICHDLDNETHGTPFDGVQPKEHAGIVRKAIQAFIHEPAQIDFDRFGNPLPKERGVAIQAFSGSADLPQLTKDVFNVTAKTPNYDLAWQSAFQGIPLMKGQLNWEIADVSTGGGFELIEEGGKVKIQSISGTKAIIGVDKYGYGLGVTWETIEGRKLYAFVDSMNQARSKMYKIWADVHYGLIGVAGATNVTDYQGDPADPTVSRDIATMNAAAYLIANGTKDSGYGDTANMPLIFYVNPLKRARMAAALAATRGDVVSGRTAGAAGSVDGQALEWNVEVRYSFNAAIPADKGLMVLPGNKVQNAMYMRELGLSKQDIESLSQINTYWTAFGAAVGDNAQTSLVDLAD